MTRYADSPSWESRLGEPGYRFREPIRGYRSAFIAGSPQSKWILTGPVYLDL